MKKPWLTYSEMQIKWLFLMEPVIYDLPIDSNLKNRSTQAAERGANEEVETDPIFKEK